MDTTLPPGWPVLAICAALIYLPTVFVNLLYDLVDLLRTTDDALDVFEEEDP